MLVELVPSFQNVKITTFCLDLLKSKEFDVWFHFHDNRHTWKSRWWDCCGHSCRKEKGTKSTLFLLPVPSPPQRSLLRFPKNWRKNIKQNKATTRGMMGKGLRYTLLARISLFPLPSLPTKESNQSSVEWRVSGSLSMLFQVTRQQHDW